MKTRANLLKERMEVKMRSNTEAENRGAVNQDGYLPIDIPPV